MISNRVLKTINFFKLEAFRLEANRWRRLKLGKIFLNIKRLPFNRNGAYLHLPTDDEIFIKDIKFFDTSTHGKIGTRRLTDLPSEEKGGQEMPLQLPKDACLFEPVHFVLFDHGILGMEFNFYGPRPGLFKRYLREKGGKDVERVEVLPLMRHEVAQTLSRLGEITLLHIGVHRDGVQQLADLDYSLHQAFSAAAKAGRNVETLEIVLRPKRWKRKAIGISRLRKKFVSWLANPDNMHIVSKLQIKAISDVTNRTENIDLLSDKLYSKKTVLKQDNRYRNVDSQSMFDAIHEAYGQMRSELISAVR